MEHVFTLYSFSGQADPVLVRGTRWPEKKFVQMNADKIIMNDDTSIKIRRNVKHQSGFIVL